MTKRIALDQLVGRQQRRAEAAGGAGGAAGCPAGRRRGLVSRAAEGSIRRSGAPSRLRGRPARDREGARRARCRRSTRSPRSATAAARRVQPGAVRHTTASIGVQLNMPLYAGGAIQNRIKETLVLEERARNDLEAARRGVTQATRAGLLHAAVGRGPGEGAGSGRSARASSRSRRRSSATGSACASTSTCSTRRPSCSRPGATWPAPRYDVLLATLRLRQASGQLTPADVLAIDRLLAP